MKSVLGQTYQNIDYIVVDGGSKDATMDIVRRYEPLFDGRMRWISEKDDGIYDAMNKGIRMAQGDVVGIINSDDYFTSSDVLERMVAAFSNDDVSLDAVYGDIHFIRDGEPDRCIRYYSSKRFHPRWLRFGFMPAHPSFYARRKVYEDYGTFDTSFRVAADFENLLRLIYVNRIRTTYIKKDVVTMRTGGASTAGFASRKTIMGDHLRALRKNGVYSNFFILSLRYVYKLYEMWFMKNPAGN